QYSGRVGRLTGTAQTLVLLAGHSNQVMMRSTPRSPILGNVLGKNVDIGARHSQRFIVIVFPIVLGGQVEIGRVNQRQPDPTVMNRADDNRAYIESDPILVQSDAPLVCRNTMGFANRVREYWQQEAPLRGRWNKSLDHVGCGRRIDTVRMV